MESRTVLEKCFLNRTPALVLVGGGRNESRAATRLCGMLDGRNGFVFMAKTPRHMATKNHRLGEGKGDADMKTPQEETEEMKANASSAYHALGLTVRDSIKISIPLAELIAVARAANEDHADWMDYESEQCNLCTALRALRATGKVEL